MKINVIIEKGENGTYDVCMSPNAKQACADLGRSVPEKLEFEFKYDVPSFLNYYSKYLSLAGLSRLTGINQKLLGHYLAGRKNPGKETTQKIETGLQTLSKELGQVKFI